MSVAYVRLTSYVYGLVVQGMPRAGEASISAGATDVILDLQHSRFSDDGAVEAVLGLT